MEKKEIKTAVGTINMERIKFGEMLIDIFIDIKSIPGDIQKRINREMEAAKVEKLQKMKEYSTDKELEWSTKGVNEEILLHIIVDNRGLSSWIEADITDKENDMLWAYVSLGVDLSEYMIELRPFIVKVVTEKISTMR